MDFKGTGKPSDYEQTNKKIKLGYASYGVAVIGCKGICEKRNYPNTLAIKMHSQLILYNKCRPCKRLIPKADSINGICPCCHSKLGMIAYRIPIRMHFLGITQATIISLMTKRYPNGVTLPFLRSQMKCSSSIGKTMRTLIKHGLIYKDKTTVKILSVVDKRGWHWSRSYKLTDAGLRYGSGLGMIIQALEDAEKFPVVSNNTMEFNQ